MDSGYQDSSQPIPIPIHFPQFYSPLPSTFFKNSLTFLCLLEDTNHIGGLKYNAVEGIK